MSNQREGQTPLLRVENIFKYFGEVKAVDNVSFDFFEAGYCFFSGESLLVVIGVGIDAAAAKSFQFFPSLLVDIVDSGCHSSFLS